MANQLLVLFYLKIVGDERIFVLLLKRFQHALCIEFLLDLREYLVIVSSEHGNLSLNPLQIDQVFLLQLGTPCVLVFKVTHLFFVLRRLANFNSFPRSSKAVCHGYATKLDQKSVENVFLT
jgi:hypothetical protein